MNTPIHKPPDTQKKESVGVVLFQLGGPDTYDAVEPFLNNLFNDPDIIDIPLGFLLRKPLAKFISSRRSVEVEELYREMGGPSPIREITNKQAEMLRDELRKRDPERDYHAFVAMRYWHPLTEETVEQVKAADVDRLALLPLYPHFSKTTTGSSFKEWNRVIKGTKLSDLPSDSIRAYPDYPPYIKAMVNQVERTIGGCCETDEPLHLLFSAHGVPLKVIKSGDPYKDHIETTVKHVMGGLSTDYPHHISYQSKVGPQKWLQPSTIDKLEQLGEEGVKHLLVVPVAFVSDHLETLHELNIQDREIAEDAGIDHYHVMPALNDSPEFIDVLAQRVLEEIKE
ncbi:MAG: Ferrochelatase [Candidatus Marinimicrobia bacterium]|nr:Ferrochelatase [Candidatus Neomarinimicrobiota bacterium]